MTDPDELSPDERGRILQLVREVVTPPRYGRVTQVFEHTSESDWSNHEASVRIPPGSDEHEPRRMPVATPGGDEIRVPREGDLVLVEYLEGDRPIVTKSVAAEQDRDRAPLGEAGDIRQTRGDLYSELAGDGSLARLAKKPADLDEPDAEVTIDDSADPAHLRMSRGKLYAEVQDEIVRLAKKDSNTATPDAEIAIDDSAFSPYLKTRRGKLYTEVQGSTARIAKKQSDSATPDAEVTIDDGPSPPTVRIRSAGGAVQVKTEGGPATVNAGSEGAVTVSGDTVEVDGQTAVVLNGGSNVVATEGDTVTIDGVASGSDTVSGTIDDKSGDVKSP